MQDYGAEKPLLQSKPPSSSFLTGADLLPLSFHGRCSVPFFVDSLQGTHCAFVCTFVHSCALDLEAFVAKRKDSLYRATEKAVTALDQDQESEVLAG